jgi:hypothetical protein
MIAKVTNEKSTRTWCSACAGFALFYDYSSLLIVEPDALTKVRESERPSYIASSYQSAWHDFAARMCSRVVMKRLGKSSHPRHEGAELSCPPQGNVHLGKCGED